MYEIKLDEYTFYSEENIQFELDQLLIQAKLLQADDIFVGEREYLAFKLYSIIIKIEENQYIIEFFTDPFYNILQKTYISFIKNFQKIDDDITNKNHKQIIQKLHQYL